MSRFFYIFFIFAFTSSLWAQGRQLTIWTSNEGVRNAIEVVAQEFTLDYGIPVKVLVLNKDLTNQFKTAALSGKGPDIFTWAHDVVGELASSGLVEPVSPPESLQKEFFPVAWEAFRYEGKFYGYPYDMEAIALIYNKKLIAHPVTQFSQVFALNKNNKKRTFLYDLGNFFFTFPILSANGGYVFGVKNGGLDAKDIGLANSGALEGARLLRRLVKEDVIPESTDRGIAFSLFKKGQLAMMIDGPWAVNELKKAKIDFGVAPIPHVGNGVPKPFVGVHGFIIRRSSSNKDLATEFIENYLLTKKGSRTLYDSDPRTPARKDLVADLSTDPVLMGFLNSAKIGVPMPNIPQMGAVWGAMGAALRNIITSDKKIEETLSFAREQIIHSLEKEKK